MRQPFASREKPLNAPRTVSRRGEPCEPSEFGPVSSRNQQGSCNYPPKHSLRRKHHVVALAFAQEQILAEQEICKRQRPLRVGLADVVDVNAAALKVLARLPFGRAKPAMDEEVNNRLAGS